MSNTDTGDVQRVIFILAYVSTALEDVSGQCGMIVDCDEDCPGGHSPDRSLTRDDLSDETRMVLERDAGTFFDLHAADLALFPGDHAFQPDEWAQRTGYQLWMSRAGHGTGFEDWYQSGRAVQDPDMEAARERLSAAARTEGERDLFMGTDDKITHGKSWGEIQRERN